MYNTELTPGLMSDFSFGLYIKKVIYLVVCPTLKLSESTKL